MTTLYVGNLPLDIKEDTLKNIFSRYGRVTGIEMVQDRISRRGRGYGLVEMPASDEASAAVRLLNGQYLRGCFLRVHRLRSTDA